MCSMYHPHLIAGEVVDNWKKRFIVLEDGLVTSYTEDPRTQPNLRPTKDTIDLMAGCQIVSIADDPAGEYATKIVWPKGAWPQTSFVVIAAKHTYYLYADAEDEAAYATCIYDHGLTSSHSQSLDQAFSLCHRRRSASDPRVHC